MNWFFWFKRFVGSLAQPLPIVCAFAALALVAACFRARRLALASAILAFATLCAATLSPLVRLAAWPLESRHRPLLEEDAARLAPKFVVVLGNGVAHPGDPAMPALSRLNDRARARLVEGVRLAKLFPDAELVVSGYGMGLESCAEAMAAAAVELGVPPGRIRALSESLDTAHEARLTAELAGDELVVVVTSAAHMPRAALYFDAMGVRTVFAPCDFIGAWSPEVRAVENRRHWGLRGGSLAQSESLCHEYLGLAYYWLSRSGRDSGHDGSR